VLRRPCGERIAHAAEEGYEVQILGNSTQFPFRPISAAQGLCHDGIIITTSTFRYQQNIHATKFSSLKHQRPYDSFTLARLEVGLLS